MVTKQINICSMTLFYFQFNFNYVTKLSKYSYNISNFLHFSRQFTVM